MAEPEKTVAVIELTVCTAYQGSGCHICYDVCPIQDNAIKLVENLPQILPDQCTGCGDCLQACPTPGAIAGQSAKIEP
jgi:NAD-dependent dihydropyrimidine dehydrogenase PreA subunit